MSRKLYPYRHDILTTIYLAVLQGICLCGCLREKEGETEWGERKRGKRERDWSY